MLHQFSAIQQNESAICVCVCMCVCIYSLLPKPPSHLCHLTPLGNHKAPIRSLCNAAASYQLSILHMVMYICQCYPLNKLKLKIIYFYLREYKLYSINYLKNVNSKENICENSWKENIKYFLYPYPPILPSVSMVCISITREYQFGIKEVF